jgi:hypothetical protein
MKPDSTSMFEPIRARHLISQFLAKSTDGAAANGAA